MAQTHIQQYQISGSLVTDISDSVSRNDLVKSGRTLFDDLNSLRTQVKGILGSNAWTDEQAINLSNLKAQLTGSLSANSASLGGTLSVAGAATFDGVADFNADVTANKVSIDGDVAQRLYIVDADGSIKDEANMIFDGSALKVTGAISGSGALSAGGALTVAGSATLNSGLTVNAAAADFNAGITANELKIDGDTAQRLYIVGASGELKDEANLVFNGSKLTVTGSFESTGVAVVNALTASNGVKIEAGGLNVAGDRLVVDGTLSITGVSDFASTFTSGNANVSGSVVVAGILDVNNTISASALKVDGDVAQRLYVVGASGELKDEANMIFDGSALKVTGAVSGSGAFEIGGTLTSAGYATLNNGLTVNGSTADFNSGITANEIKVDGDVAQRLYIVGATGELKDEANMIFDGSALKVTGAVSGSGAFDAGGALTVAGASDLNGTLDVAGQVDLAAAGVATNVRGTLSVSQDATFAGNVSVDGDLRVKGSMTYIDTTNMRVQDAFIYLATGSLGTSDSGIVLHGGAGANMDLVLGQDGGAGEFILGKADRSPDGEGEMDGITLVPAWASGIKLGLAESALSGSLMVDSANVKLSAVEDLKFEAHGNVVKLGSDAEYDLFVTQFGAGATLLGALGAGSGIGISFRKKVTAGSAVNGSNQLDMFSTFGDRLRANGDAAYGLDVYLNGVMLAQGAGLDYSVSGTDIIQFNYAVNSDDVITVVLRNAA